MTITHLSSFFEVFPQVLTGVFPGLNGGGAQNFFEGLPLVPNQTLKNYARTLFEVRARKEA